MIELLRIYKTMVLTSFFDFIQAPSMRISLILHLNFAHIKPQQPNCFDSCTDTEKSQSDFQIGPETALLMANPT